jgi:3-deoxy-D-manno-octulosonate 8-phosphate phosphatase (KDO 8-P phosphatase)
MHKNIKLPKLILSDIDGVWTDGGMYYDQTGNEWKKFNTSDSMGILFCKEAKIATGIITSENTEIVQKRSEKLKIDFLFQGIKNKLEIVEKLSKELAINLDEIAYIGDDVGDFHVLKNAGFSGTPQNAPDYIKEIVDFVTKKNGGDGAFREFVEYIFQINGIFEKTLNSILKNK